MIRHGVLCQPTARHRRRFRDAPRARARDVVNSRRATNSSVAINEPNTDTGNPGTGTGTTPSTPPTPPAKASQGPKHAMCVHENDHIPDNARVHGANWYRFYDRAACTALQAMEDFVSIF